MTGINHAVTGALVAVAIKQPAVALPLAFLSHFAIDSLPHWNYWVPGQRRFRKWVIFSDMLLSLALIAAIAFSLVGVDWWVVLLGGLLAISPDLMWLPYLIIGKPAPADTDSALHRLRRFHLRIQWSETIPGLLVEFFWLAFMLFLIFKMA
jgi:hypothetical protein